VVFGYSTRAIYAQPRYAKMTDTVFHVGDLIQHRYYPIYVLRPYPMRFPDENCASHDETGFHHFLELIQTGEVKFSELEDEVKAMVYLSMYNLKNK
jgi:hypothetical protein